MSHPECERNRGQLGRVADDEVAGGGEEIDHGGCRDYGGADGGRSAVQVGA
jgi:hypothetical protein